MIICPKCNSKIPKNLEICPYCGYIESNVYSKPEKEPPFMNKKQLIVISFACVVLLVAITTIIIIYFNTSNEASTDSAPGFAMPSINLQCQIETNNDYSNSIPESEIDDQDSDTPTPTPTISPTPTPTPIPTPEPLDKTYAGYREILLAYHNELKLADEGNDCLSTKALNSCSLTDITGDGFPELIILYRSDYEYTCQPDNFIYADIRIFTIQSGETTATEMLHLNSAIEVDVVADLVLLNNGNLLFKQDNFTYSECSYTEYALNGNSFQPVNTLEMRAIYGEDGDWDNVYYFNDTQIDEFNYNDQINNYANMLSIVFMNDPYGSADTEWETNILNTSNGSMTFEEAWNEIAPTHNSEPILSQDQAIEAFENYMSENYAWDVNEPSPYGTSSYYWYVEEFCDEYTCVYALEGYLGANAYLYKYFFMDLTTGSVYTIEYEDSVYSAGEEPGIAILGSEIDVFNALDYIN